MVRPHVELDGATSGTAKIPPWTQLINWSQSLPFLPRMMVYIGFVYGTLLIANSFGFPLAYGMAWLIFGGLLIYTFGKA